MGDKDFLLGADMLEEAVLVAARLYTTTKIINLSTLTSALVAGIRVTLHISQSRLNDFILVAVLNSYLSTLTGTLMAGTRVKLHISKLRFNDFVAACL